MAQLHEPLIVPLASRKVGYRRYGRSNTGYRPGSPGFFLDGSGSKTSGARSENNGGCLNVLPDGGPSRLRTLIDGSGLEELRDALRGLLLRRPGFLPRRLLCGFLL